MWTQTFLSCITEFLKVEFWKSLQCQLSFSIHKKICYAATGLESHGDKETIIFLLNIYNSVFFYHLKKYTIDLNMQTDPYPLMLAL